MSKERLIIEAHDMPMQTALPYALEVVRRGRISGKQYCYHTVYKDGVQVSSFLNEKSDRLVVYMSEKGEG